MLDLFGLLGTLSDVITVSVCFGLALAVLWQPRRTVVNTVFSAFCATLGLLEAVSIAGVLPLYGSLPNDWLVVQIIISLFGLMILLYYLFIILFTGVGGWLRRLLVPMCVVFLIALPLSWARLLVADVLPYGPTSRYLVITPLGYLFLAYGLLCMLLAVWALLSGGERGRLLRVPALILVASYAVDAVPVVVVTPLDTVLSTTAVVWMAWVVLRLQVFNPLRELNAELEVANSDLKKLVAELAKEKNRAERLNEELQEAVRYKSQFLMTMSHELRTPLNSIVGYSELLRNGVYGQMTAQQLDRLEKIHRNGATLLDVISEILDLSKIEAGRLELDTDTVPLSALLLQVLAGVGASCEQKGLELRVSLADDLHAVLGDELRLRQIFENLLSNAIKFTPAGFVGIRATNLRVKEGRGVETALPIIGWLSDGDWTLTEVSDSGIGIAPEDQALIFEAFAQADGSRTRAFEGTGLGLTITRKLVELHGGTLWVRSQVGQGSTFFVALPARHATLGSTPAYRDVLGQRG